MGIPGLKNPDRITGEGEGMFNSSPEISRNILFSNEEAKERKAIYNSTCITNIINGIFNNLKKVSFLSLMKIKENNISAEDLTIKKTQSWHRKP